MGETRNAYKFPAGELHRIRMLARTRQRCEDHVKLNFEEACPKGIVWIHPAQDCEHCKERFSGFHKMPGIY
jgi:hypothetical protein